jgi:hypothetical protein
MITKEQIEARIEQSKANSAVTIGSDELLEICKLALQGLAVQPMPIEEAPKDGTWILGYWPIISRWMWGICHYNHDGWRNQYGSKHSVLPTHFILLSALPKAPS